MNLSISIIILTYNEGKNIRACLESVKDISDEIIVVDSYSTDNTVEIVKEFDATIYQHAFENYSLQRNWSLKNLPIKNEWILNLDADHRVTFELKDELQKIFSGPIDKNVNGLLISRRTVFMNKWIKHGGHYPTYHAILFRKSCGSCEDRLYDQHFVVNGNLQKLSNDIIDIISDSLETFITRHNKWATLEAMEQLIERNDNKTLIEPSFFGNSIERRRAQRNMYNSFPLFIRSFLYFIYRYFFRLGFMDGKEGMIYHFLQGFWYRFLVDAKIYQIEQLAKKEDKSIKEIIKEHYKIVV